MRFRAWAIVSLILLIVVVTVTACAPGGRSSQVTPIPTKTLRPTFTHTPAKPAAAFVTATPAVPSTATRQATALTAPPPTAVPPTVAPPTPTATPEKATLTITDPPVNLRAGPGTNYPIVGEVRGSQTFEITGKNAAGDWWQFTFEGKPVWVSGQFVRPNAAAGKVPVAADIPAAPPTARPQPTSPPAPAPTQAPPPSLFAQAGAEFRNADDANFDKVTFWGRLGKIDEFNASGYKLRVSAPSGSSEVPFNAIWQDAYAGYGSSAFKYNVKLELPRTAGAFRAVVVDGSGKEVSDAVTGTLLDRAHDVLLNWWKR
ncbi:MAG: SH3 domain-containing protein [Chloroflexi bacterium]|nr:SH3 domain-containing protein [Chloroflexota bacterium]